MVRPTIAGSLVAGLLLASGVAPAPAEGCSSGADDGVKRVTYIVVDMPEQSSSLPTPTPSATPQAIPQNDHVIEDIPANVPPAVKPETLRPAVNTTHTFGPTPDPNIDLKDPANIVPAKNISLFYAATETEQQGTINMTLALKNPAVVLEQVDAVKDVVCGDDDLTVSFSAADSFNQAVKDWSASDEGFILITNHMGNCDVEFERGFFLATGVTSDEDNLSIKVSASKEDLSNIAGECEMSFTSLPAATLAKRLTIDPSLSLSFAKALANDTVIYSDPQYVNITAEEAWFSSTITFSGYLKYNFWGFKLEALYFDLDATFDSAVGLSADVMAAYSTQLKYAPDALTYTLVSVPGVVSLGPGVAFAIGMDFDVSAAVGVDAGLSVTMPNANVHLDLLDRSKTSTTGWDPKYSTYANITQAADVHLDASAELTVELAFKLLGGIVDLSSGLTAAPGFDNTFKLRGDQKLGLGGNFTSVPDKATADLPPDVVACAEQNGVEFTTDFYFNLTGYATKYWSGELYSTRLPLWDLCYHF